MIIDAHCHAGTGDGLRGPWDTEAPLEPYRARARLAGIDRTVVFPVFNREYAAANERLARIVRREPQRLIGFCAVHPQHDRHRMAAMIGRATQELGLRGIKVHGADALPGREVCEAARRYRVPVIVDVVRQTAAVEMMASQYPDVDFIVPHLGGFVDDWTAHLATIDQLCRYPNVYADTSGVRYFDALVQAVRRAGPHKLIFGSDGPQLHPGVELHKIHLMGLRPSAQQLVLGGNVARLLDRHSRPEASRGGTAGISVASR